MTTLGLNKVAFDSGATATTDLMLAMANERDIGGLPGNPRDLTLQGEEGRGSGCAIEDAALWRSEESLQARGAATNPKYESAVTLAPAA